MPTRLGRYEVRAKIADGGMATVYLGKLAPDSVTDRKEDAVALKVIKDEYSLDRDFVNMFLDEAKIVSKLAHPNVVSLLALGTEGNRLFIAMELLLGQSLWSVWEACRERRVRLRYDLVSWIGARVAEGLHHAHELKDANGAPQHVVHRDVNASNIFLTYDGRVKVIDFGLAKAANRISRTGAGIVKGKLAYMSPEQTVGKPLDRRTDIFALGTTLWEVTTDRRLFKGADDVETLTAVHNAVVPDPTRLVAGYPQKLWAVLRRALERDREKRYSTGLELSVALDACAASEGREITANTLADVMRSLFDYERQRQIAWLADASAVNRVVPLNALVPPRDSVPYGTMGPGDPGGAPGSRNGPTSSDLYNAAATTPAPSDLSRPLVAPQTGDPRSNPSRTTVPEAGVLVAGGSVEEHLAERPAPIEPPPSKPSGAGFLLAGAVVVLVAALLLVAAIGAAVLWKP
jgi:eukaryotic-like serine/threonine-protein kinase